MPRIISGTAAGRRLDVGSASTRPTTDRVREAVFSALDHRLGDWADVAVLDLFAGSGAMGLEAASRGARSVVLVERDRRALASIRSNIARTGLADVEVVSGDAWSPHGLTVGGRELTPADVVVLDPPYDQPASRLEKLLAQLHASGLCAPSCLAVVERPTREGRWDWPAAWSQVADRRYGETRILIGALVAST